MNDYGIENKNVISQGESSVLLEFFISEKSVYFDGHFPSFKLLPAVAQLDIISRFADKYFSCGCFAREIRRIKFVSPVFPNTLVRLSLSFDKNKTCISFVFFRAEDASKVFCQGSYYL